VAKQAFIQQLRDATKAAATQHYSNVFWQIDRGVVSAIDQTNVQVFREPYHL
jgi:hypothetical protein